MARLDIKPEEVVRLWLEEELSIKEIARHYGSGTTTIKQRLRQARVQNGDAWWRACRWERMERRRVRREERAREAYRLRTGNNTTAKEGET